MERDLDKWHKEISRAAAYVCHYLVKRKASKSGLLLVASILERVAKDIRSKIPEQKR